MTYDPSEFCVSASNAFSWLEDLGFREDGHKIHNLYGEVWWISAMTYVEVTWDIHDQSLDVDVGPLVNGGRPSPGQYRDASGRRVRAPLWLLLWVGSGDETAGRTLSTYSDQTRESVEQALDRNAKALRQFGIPLLEGDFSTLPELDRADEARIAANIARRPWGSPPRSSTSSLP